jgi:hypothetical protein
MKDRHDDGDRLDWPGGGLSPRARAVIFAAAEAILSDEDALGELVPGPKSACDRAVDALDHAIGRGSKDLQRGFGVVSFLLEWLPIFVVGSASRMSRLALAPRVRYLEALEASKIGLLSMLMIAVKVPLCIPAFEEGDELALTGFDRASTASRRKLPLGREGT